LVLYPSKTLNEICDFFKISFSDRMMEYYQLQDTKMQEPKVTLDWKKKTKEKPDTERVNRYKNALTKEEILTFNSKASSHLENYGYEL
jgi:hypothetical protein